MKNDGAPMDRVPEPELMDSPEQARAYAEADFEEPHSRFVAAFAECFPAAAVAGRVLDLGCGPADITIRFARAFPDTRIDGLDAGPNMLVLGREAVAAAGLGERIRLVQGRLPDQGPPQPPYDVVISNSLLHHLANPGVLWQAVRGYGRPGGLVFIMDLRRPRTAREAKALVDCHAADEPEVLRRDFHNSLCAAYRPAEVREQLRTAGLDGLRVSAPGDRHLIVSGVLG